MKQSSYAFSKGNLFLYPALACTGLCCAAVFSDPGELLRNWGLLGILFLIARHDADDRKIPDRCVLAAVCMGFVFGGPDALSAGLASVFLVMLLLALVFLLQRMVAKHRPHGTGAFLGGGDVKLLLAAGLFLNPYECLRMIFLAGCLGIVTAICYHFRKEGPFPFGPAIAAAMACMLFS